MAICNNCSKKYSKLAAPCGAEGICRECFEAELEIRIAPVRSWTDRLHLWQNTAGKHDDGEKWQSCFLMLNHCVHRDSFLSRNGKPCDCRSERGEENTERRAFFTLPRIQIFLSSQRLTKISPACQRRNRHKRGSLIRVPKTLPALHQHGQRNASRCRDARPQSQC